MVAHGYAIKFFYFPEGTEHSTADIVISTRIGIQGAGPEWAQLPLRFVWFFFLTYPKIPECLFNTVQSLQEGDEYIVHLPSKGGHR